MQIILREDIDKLGNRGVVVKVKDGYARNFLLPRRLAVNANESNKKIVEQERQAHLRKEATLKGQAEELGKLMANLTIVIKQKAGENDHLFGSVTAQDIANALEAQKYTIDRKKIVLDEPIKQLGDYKITVKLHKDVSVEIPLSVTKDE